ncbi:MAG: hypothetical protein RQ715_08035 [Methylococcales bacterium]|nr:hypothetical protein [Methylococcales bacterium]
MKMLSKATIALFLSLATAGVSTTAQAYEEGRTTYAPAQAIDNVLSLAQEAASLIASGAAAEDIADKIKAASDMSKEINANDQVDIARNRANKHLKKARNEAKKGNIESASEHLNTGIDAFGKLKSLL